MKKLIFGLLVIGLTSQMFSQVIELAEIKIAAVNYKYISAVTSDDMDINVKMLEEKVAFFDLKNAEFYVDEYHTYKVKFYIPNGAILVAYDREGEIIRTIERFKDVKLPVAVRNAVFEKYPGWKLKKDVYRVSYKENISDKVYKVIIEKENKILRIKVDEKGRFIGKTPSTIEL